MIHRTRLFGSSLLMLLAFTCIGGGSFAGGSLFDEGYRHCPPRTRLRDSPIQDLTLARDGADEGKVNVSWAATDPATWNLGPNAYRASLVVLLDDGDGEGPKEQALSLNAMQTAFDDVRTGIKATVQLAIVVDTADHSYLVSDVLEARINQSLTKPSFSTGWHRVSSVDNADTARGTRQFVLTATAVDAGTMHYIGYNENFGNYRSSDDDWVTTPLTPRLRIGLAHAAAEDNDARDNVGFNAYIIRITDENGDVVPEGDDVATMTSNYGTEDYEIADSDIPTVLKAANKLFVYDLTTPLELNPGPNPKKDTVGAGGYALSNVRIVDGNEVSVAMHNSDAITNRDGVLEPDTVPASMIRVDALGAGNVVAVGDLFAEPPHEHRDFPADILVSDTTYVVEVWAINDDDEVISPIATLKVRPLNTAYGAVIGFQDYQLTSPVDLDDLTITEFTVFPD